MKKLFLILIALLLAFPAQAATSVHRHIEPETLAYQALSGAAQTQFATNENVKAIKYVSGVTLSSVTLDMSTGATGVITNVSQDIRWLSSTVWGSTALLLTVNDGTNNFTLTPATAGTGETLGAEKLDAWTNNGFDTFTTSGTDISQAAEVGANNVLCYDDTGLNIGPLMKFVLGAYSKTSGSTPYLILGSANNLSTTEPTFSNRVVSSPAVGNYYFTRATNNAYSFFGFRNIAGATDWTASGMSMKQVLTPDTSGILFTDGSGALFAPNLAGDGPYSITVELAP